MKLAVLLGMAALIALVSADEAHWKEHIRKHKLNFEHDGHHNQSRARFLKHKKHVDDHNQLHAQGKVSYTIRTNHLSHLSDNELQRFKGIPKDVKRTLEAKSRIFKNRQVSYSLLKATPNFIAPDRLDYVDKINVAQTFNVPVRDQQACGSCWSFAAAAAVEAAYRVQKGVATGPLSPQQLVDCADHDYGTYGCEGGFGDGALAYLVANQNAAFVSEADYPYTQQQGSCVSKPSAKKAPIASFIQVDNNEKALIEALVTKGPLWIGMDVSPGSFQSLHQGVWDGKYGSQTCSNTPDHAMLLVGYGTENGTPYFRVKNQWGEGWGDKGYFKVRRNGNGYCGITTMAFAAVAK